MKNPEYNLLDEPWIPVRLVDGTITDVGLLELLRRTTDIADLACDAEHRDSAIDPGDCVSRGHSTRCSRLGQAVG